MRFSKHSRLTLFIFILFTTASLFGCGGGTQANNSTPPPIVRSNVYVLPADGSVTISEQTDNSVTLTGNSSGIQPGTILVSGSGQGLLRKVTAVTQNGNSAIAQTTSAGLEDVFQQANIQMQKNLTPADFQAITPLLPGITVAPSRAVRRRDSGLGINLNFLKVKFPASDGDPGGVLELNGDLSLDVSIDFCFQTDIRGLVCARFVPKVTDTLDLKVSGKLNYTFAQLKKKIAHLEGAPIDIQVGIVPVVIVPILDIYMQADGTVETGFEFTSGASLTLGAGIEYTRAAGWHPITQITHDVNFVPVTNIYTSVKGTFTPFRPEFGLLIYGVAGPYIASDAPRLELELKRQTGPPGLEITTQAVFEGSGGFKAEILGQDAADYNRPDLLQESIKIYDHLFPDDGTINLGIH